MTQTNTVLAPELVVEPDLRAAIDPGRPEYHDI